MPLPYHPKPGTIVVCDYAAGGFRQPEMTKRRLAVTISPKLKRRNDLVTVVPLSQTKPTPLEPWHTELIVAVPHPWGGGPRWAKCDMVATVGYARLNLPHTRHPVTNQRLFVQIELPEHEVEALRKAVSAALGI